jgi:signal transduction histidine kinase
MGIFVTLACVGMFILVLNRRGSGGVVENGLLVLAFSSIGAVGALIVARFPRNAVGWLFLATASLAATGFVADQLSTYDLVTRPGSLGVGPWMAWVNSWIWILYFGPFLIFVPLLFPDGRLASPRWRPVAWAAATAIGVAVVSTAFAPGSIEGTGFRVANPAGIDGVKAVFEVAGAATFFTLVASLVLATISLVKRYRRSAGEERARFKWFVYGLMILLLTFILNIVLGFVLGNEEGNQILFDVGVVAVPVGAGMAILRHRIYDIDVVINRTIVVGALAAFVTVVYAALVVGIGAAVVGKRANTFLTLLAAVVIALAFQPVRARAQRFANRMVFGKRATPYEVLSAFADKVGGGYAGDDLLLEMARTVGEGVGAGTARVWLRVGPELQVAGAWPGEAPPASPVRMDDGEVPAIPGTDGVFPVRHEGEVLGALTVTTARGERLKQVEERLIGDLAAQAGLVLRNVRLIEELRASRQRIVAASDAERRRLERNIHDGAQQQLVAMAMKLRLARGFTRKDLDRTETLLEDVEHDAQSALETLRDLARGIYPPLLADQGLGAALAAQARRAAIPVSVEADGVGRYAQDVEAAAYFCCLEAVQNAAKYGGGAPATISLAERDGVLHFMVVDQGPGFDLHTMARGSGLQNMQDRIEALGGTVTILSRPGGGTTVHGQVPVGSR